MSNDNVLAISVDADEVNTDKYNNLILTNKDKIVKIIKNDYWIVANKRD